MRPHFRARALLVGLICAATVLIPRVAAQASPALTVDNSHAGFLQGEVLDTSPEHTKVVVKNPYHFWGRLIVGSTGELNLKPAPLARDLAGIWASEKMIPPLGTAAWEGSFTGPGSQTVTGIYDVHANFLSAMVDAIGVRVAASPSAWTEALGYLNDLPLLIDVARYAQHPEQPADPWLMAQAIAKALGTAEGQASVAKAFDKIGVSLTPLMLRKLLSVFSLYSIARTLSDSITAAVALKGAGLVLFVANQKITTTRVPPSAAIDPALVTEIRSGWPGMAVFLPDALPPAWQAGGVGSPALSIVRDQQGYAVDFRNGDLLVDLNVVAAPDVAERSSSPTAPVGGTWESGQFRAGLLSLSQTVGPYNLMLVWPIDSAEAQAAAKYIAEHLTVTKFEVATTTSTTATQGDDLPPAVAQTRADLLAAAAGGDFDRLEQLALRGSTDFTFTWGDPTGGPAAYWRSEVARGEDVVAELTRILQMPSAQDGDMYWWPAAFTWPTPWTADQRRWLLANFPEDFVTGWEEYGGYVGYRVGITTEGSWGYFVAGD